MTPVLCCGFECGTTSVPVHCSLTNAGILTNTPRTGLRHLDLSTTGVTAYATFNKVSTSTIIVARFYVYYSLKPTVTTHICSFGSAGLFLLPADGKLYCGASTTLLGATGVAVTLNQWTQIDFAVDITSANWTVNAQVDGTAITYASSAAAGSASFFIIGSSSVNATGSEVVDDVILSQTLADYPIGAGKVLSFVPASDGTHTSTTTIIVKGTIATPVGANVAGATDTFNWINGRPLLGGATDNTRLINQQTIGSTLYQETVIEQTTETTGPRAVEIVVADRQASTAAGDMHIKLNDNGTEAVILDRTAVAGVITDRFTTKQFAAMVGGGNWTLTRFKGLRFRFGYSTDATPDQYFRGLMVEAEFPYAVVADTQEPLILLGVG